MKQRHLCPKCGENRILFLSRLDQVVGEYGQIEAWRVARVPESPEGFPLPGGEPVAAGVVQAYICKGCGYTELYTLDPETIPIDGKLVRELVGPSKAGPYR